VHGASARKLDAGAIPQATHVLPEKTGEGVIAHGVLLEIIVLKEIAGIFIISQLVKAPQV